MLNQQELGVEVPFLEIREKDEENNESSESLSSIYSNSKDENSNKDKSCPSVSGIIQLSNKIAMNGEKVRLMPLRLRSLSMNDDELSPKKSGDSIFEKEK